MNGSHGKLRHLFDRYVCLEKEIQQLIYRFSRHYCGVCAGKCCREEICRESIESTFLSVLVEKQRIRYDDQSGWQGAAGCRLDYGRPLVCYDYFCEEITESDSFPTPLIQELIKEFVAIGNKAHGNTHLLCIANPGALSPAKIEKLCQRIRLVFNRTARARACLDTLQSEPMPSPCHGRTPVDIALGDGSRNSSG